MDFLLKVLAAFLIFMMAWMFQEESQLWDLTRTEMKKANNFATHDAAQQIDKEHLADGRLIIDPNLAMQAFITSLRENLGLDENLEPIAGSPLHNPVIIRHFEILDQSNTVFPYLYENQTYHIAKWLRGPAVIAVIESDYVRILDLFSGQDPIRVPAISEYAMYR